VIEQEAGYELRQPTNEYLGFSCMTDFLFRIYRCVVFFTGLLVDVDGDDGAQQFEYAEPSYHHHIMFVNVAYVSTYFKDHGSVDSTFMNQRQAAADPATPGDDRVPLGDSNIPGCW
jgi:hypothetical protein